MNHIEYDRLISKNFFEDYYARHMAWCRLYRRSDIEYLKFTPEVRISDDTLFNLRAVSSIAAPAVYRTSAKLYYYLIRADSIVRTTDHDKFLDFGKWYREHSREVGSNGWEWTVCMQALKLTLSCRYLISYEADYAEKKGYVNSILWFCYRQLIAKREVALREKIIHFMMIAFPSLYRSFRVINDPTMKEWENQQKSNLV